LTSEVPYRKVEPPAATLVKTKAHPAKAGVAGPRLLRNVGFLISWWRPEESTTAEPPAKWLEIVVLMRRRDLQPALRMGYDYDHRANIS
jgi:hypothetical protein